MRVAKLHEDAIIPTRKHKGDAGFDLYSIDTYITLNANEFRIIHTGITIEIPKNTVGLIFPKSGTNFLIGAGVIDNTYQGEILVSLLHPTGGIINKGNAIAQIIFVSLVGGDSWDLTEAPKDEIHVVKSLRHTSGGIKTATLTSTAELISKQDAGNSWD